jgi:hypothetical protein
MKDWKPADYVAVVIVLGLVLWGLISIIGVWQQKRSFSEAGGEILLAIVGIFGTTLGYYFGRSKRNGNGKPE